MRNTKKIILGEMDMLPFIQKGIAESHPEFKQKVIKPKEEDHFFNSNTSEYDLEQHIVCTMPEVDDNRYDVLKEGVNTLYDQCTAEMDKIKVKYSEMLADKTKELPKDEVDEAKKKQEDLINQYTDIINAYRDQKLMQIEENHNKYLSIQAEERLKRLNHNRV